MRTMIQQSVVKNSEGGRSLALKGGSAASGAQIRLWKKMIQLIGGYQAGTLSFRRLTDSLEEVLDKADFHDARLIDNWYGFWEELGEIARESAYAWEFDAEKARPAVERMLSFLSQELEVWTHEGFQPAA